MIINTTTTPIKIHDHSGIPAIFPVIFSPLEESLVEFPVELELSNEVDPVVWDEGEGTSVVEAGAVDELVVGVAVEVVV